MQCSYIQEESQENMKFLEVFLQCQRAKRFNNVYTFCIANILFFFIVLENIIQKQNACIIFFTFWLQKNGINLRDGEQWPDFGCEGIKVQRAHQPTSQCQGKNIIQFRKNQFILCSVAIFKRKVKKI
eukprot:TRINITY_DN9525_c0_g1_i5.p4 TRINITY_DN9525_c0_g1~~TRINITY_DN9525_c0_g1_i5.p4  ORF type:complete len:127 (+),score=1.60 TRINITY_DN9525_c0_g1_i5:600-980(+)